MLNVDNDTYFAVLNVGMSLEMFGMPVRGMSTVDLIAVIGALSSDLASQQEPVMPRDAPPMSPHPETPLDAAAAAESKINQYRRMIASGEMP